eukprot:m.247508 g.247508  ORF g.247508 m.247508 type:complete len:380 (+) comp51439_c0_seq1:1067-2206(+)
MAPEIAGLRALGRNRVDALADKVDRLAIPDEAEATGAGGRGLQADLIFVVATLSKGQLHGRHLQHRQPKRIHIHTLVVRALVHLWRAKLGQPDNAGSGAIVKHGGGAEAAELDGAPVHIQAPAVDVAVHNRGPARVKEVQGSDNLSAPCLQHVQARRTGFAKKLANGAVGDEVGDKNQVARGLPEGEERQNVGVTNALQHLAVTLGEQLGSRCSPINLNPCDVDSRLNVGALIHSPTIAARLECSPKIRAVFTVLIFTRHGAAARLDWPEAPILESNHMVVGNLSQRGSRHLLHSRGRGGRDWRLCVFAFLLFACKQTDRRLGSRLLRSLPTNEKEKKNHHASALQRMRHQQNREGRENRGRKNTRGAKIQTTTNTHSS